MAISKNIILKKLSGHIGKELVVKQYGDKTVITKYPDMSNRKLSEKQKANNETMADATYWALGIIRTEELRKEAQLRLNVTSNRLYPALIRDYFKNHAENKK